MTKEEFWNLPIGEEFTLGSKKLKVCKDWWDCKRCFFRKVGYGKGCCKLQDYGMLPQCANCFREDKTDVYFNEVEDESKN